jgi:small conductance mechanosensitive channel
MDMDAVYETLMSQAVNYAPKLLFSIITLIVGLWVIGFVVRAANKQMSRRNIDASLRHFLISLSGISLKLLLFITVAGMVGIEMTSFIALVGAAGLAIGLALQGSLGNFAGGVLILIFKPFKVGDYIEAQGLAGTVNQIQVFCTILKTPDNKTIVIPNGKLSNESIVNYSTEEKRRVDMLFGIGYGDDIDKAKKVIMDLVVKDERILKDPAPQIKLKELGNSSVNLTVRMWAKSKDYWNIYFDMQENVKKGFDKNKISIPFPQRDVHLYKH